jgi:hypothetical protein
MAALWPVENDDPLWGFILNDDPLWGFISPHGYYEKIAFLIPNFIYTFKLHGATL